MEWEMVGHDLETGPEAETGGGTLSMLGSEWEALGPFPSGMREHALTRSPLYAYADEKANPDVWFARLQYDETATWPSDLPAGGRVGWTRCGQGKDGWVEVSYPEVNWQQLRSDHGWAALQYEVILRSCLDIASTADGGPAGLLIDSSQLVEYAFVPEGAQDPNEWYNGDMYDFANSPIGRNYAEGFSSNFARSIALDPGKYTVLVRVVYEIRMFGDPGAGAPMIRFKLDIRPDPVPELALVPGLDIVPDTVDGRLMGKWIGIGIRVPGTGSDAILEHCTAVHEGCDPDAEILTIANTPITRIVAGQTRRIPLRIRQNADLDTDSKLQVRLRFALGPDRRQTVHLVWKSTPRWRNRNEYFKFTFDPSIGMAEANTAEATSITCPQSHLPPQIGYAIAIPPPPDAPEFASGIAACDIPVTLGVHGAGVDVEWETWINALPKTGGWTVLPTGKNEWGEDWHGASMQDAWAARDALQAVVRGLCGEVSDQTLIIGHSNGGQGAWHLASRYPDRVVGVIGAAGYVKVQDYVPYTETVSSHFADPALSGILSASLTPYNNDLYLSNLAHVPCIALHGGADGNVPPRHSRIYASTINSWSKDKDAVEVVEVEGKDHWWDGMLNHPRVSDFIRGVIGTKRRSFGDERRKGFTLTTACVEETGYKAGTRVVELETPGKLGRLDVFTTSGEQPGSESLQFRGTNIKRIDVIAEDDGRLRSFTCADGQWQEVPKSSQVCERESWISPAPGPIIRMLSSREQITFIVGPHQLHHSLAKRLAHDLFVYHRLDSDITSADDAIHEHIVGNIVIIGRPEENAYLHTISERAAVTPVTFPRPGVIRIDPNSGNATIKPAKEVYESQAGIISLLAHPTSAGLALVIAGNSDEGTQAAARLFPLRTGVPIPDWAVVGPKMAYRGAGGMIGAGFWSYGPDGYLYNPVMSWFDR